jgi:hypothetical protein
MKYDDRCLIKQLNTNQLFLFFNKTNQMHKFIILFCQKTLHILGISFAHHQELFTVHTVMVHSLQFHPDPTGKLSPNLQGIYHYQMYSR